MKKFLVTAAMLLGLFPAHADTDAGPSFLRMGDRQVVDLARFTDETAGSEVVFIGEAHDDVLEHRRQVQILRGLHARKLPLAIGIEMFPSDAQKYLDDWVQGKVDEERFRKVYAAVWSYDWSLNRELFLFARDNRIPMIALNVPKRIISTVVRSGAAALTAVDRDALPPGLSWNLNPHQMGYLKRIREQVFGPGGAVFPLQNFAEAQALRNASFAWNIARFREKAPKTRVVAISGTWHAIRNGAPGELKKYGDPSCTVVLPKFPEFDLEKMTKEEADYVLMK